MKDRTNDQQGAQRHAEGEYGDEARERNRERLQEPIGDTGETTDETDQLKSDRVGKHRLYEGRVQHDEADLNSEKNRLARDRDKNRAE